MIFFTLKGEKRFANINGTEWNVGRRLYARQQTMPGNKLGLAYSEGLGKIALDKKMSVGDLSPYANAIEQL